MWMVNLSSFSHSKDYQSSRNTNSCLYYRILLLFQVKCQLNRQLEACNLPSGTHVIVFNKWNQSWELNWDSPTLTMNPETSQIVLSPTKNSNPYKCCNIKFQSQSVQSFGWVDPWYVIIPHHHRSHNNKLFKCITFLTNDASSWKVARSQEPGEQLPIFSSAVGLKPRRCELIVAELAYYTNIKSLV